MKPRWMIRCSKIDIKELAKEAGVSEVIANILVNRGIKEPNEIKKFLRASIEDLYDPFLMKDMDKGTDIIIDAIKEEKHIVIYGDYDCDGVTSTVILYSALKRCGANIKYYIPDRENEGYGICSERVKKLKEEGIEVIITCDNGIASLEEIELAKKLGMTVIVTDHHDLKYFEEDSYHRKYIMPEADAIINPKRRDCKYPFKSLCGAAVAFKFVQALYKKMDIDEKEALEFIEFAGIGTICDIVDLVDENRIIVKNALKMISNTNNLGLKTLIQEVGLENKEIKSYHIGFQIGPCINATGRLDTAALAVELFLTNDKDKALELSKKLCDLNRERQDMTNKNVEEVINIIESSELIYDKVLVIYKEDIHESIAGIVAGKIRDEFNVPTIILTNGKNTVKGSARSIEQYNIFEELTKCKDLLEKFGGHPMAAGLSLKKENIHLLRKTLNKNCILTEKDIIPKIIIDRKVSLEDISFKLIEELEFLEPFGKGNSSPLLAEKDVDIEKIQILGKDKNTLKLFCKIKGDDKKIEALGFGKVKEFEEMMEEEFGNSEKIIDNPKGLKMDFIFYPCINEYRGFVNIQMKIVDFRMS
ncbi:single-stranded-DNA-specific exonuclease RecJ [Clostridium acetireducens DSM 10703]|uniref:Single-stranded-DNA-specific exonuclease RecJ n=1 Tax=Clostridium acetireducens DSM 10703 TaxID=1121290 RepID=A0A1E8EZG0_9CLOT|nr:single-stranded-DNA-specific exonuclease RecJ [Clostridium acetireducens]OFI06536.1 single-stranded-DNA-specific exonuclease RecJ [Clostridium acetireducens DSM 10703]